jgi:hypothetical protein
MQDQYAPIPDSQSIPDSPINPSKRNRKRSKRRGIFCPIHGGYMDSMSQKYPMYAETVAHLQDRGVGRRTASLLIATHTTLPLTGEWLEAFWCEHCQQTAWYYVKRSASNAYEVRLAPPEFWQQVGGVVHPQGNPSVGEFTRKAARMSYQCGVKQFSFVQ